MRVLGVLWMGGRSFFRASSTSPRARVDAKLLLFSLCFFFSRKVHVHHDLLLLLFVLFVLLLSFWSPRRESPLALDDLHCMHCPEDVVVGARSAAFTHTLARSQ